MPKNFKNRPLYAQSLPQEITKPKLKWKIFPLIWSTLKRTATVLGFFVLIQMFVVLFIVLPASLSTKEAVSLPKKMVLYLEIKGPLNEVYIPQGFASAFEPEPLTLKQTVDALNKAALDERVNGLLVRIKSASMGMTQAYELNQALDAFKESGKFAHVYSSSYGETAPGLGAYAFISNFDEIWMQPLGVVSITGLHAYMPFMRELLDKIGVTPNFFQRKDYKSAYENLTHARMTPENREVITRLIGDIRSDVLNVVPANLEMDQDDFDRLVNDGLFTASAAKEAGLITHVDYADVLVGNIKEAVTGDREADDDLFVGMRHYAMDALKPKAMGSKGSKVALVYAVGTIMQSSGSSVPGAASNVAAAEDIAPAILAAANDEDVRAIVLRVDSPGGSPVASESILRAIERAKDKDKLIIVSMGATAASGGYWISAYADHIFVMPSTVTGSIGVVGGKFAFDGLFDKVNVNWDGVQWGRNSGLWSIDSAFSKSEASRINAMLDAVYDGFITRVAKGRNMSEQDVDQVAGGRVWSGARAIDVGLADQIGGLNDALDYVAVELGKADRSDLNVVIMPEPKTTLEQFLELVEGHAVFANVMRQNKTLFDWLQPLNEAVVQVQNPHDFMVMEQLSVQ
ncbi:MAG: signal peptide peptidase SppA [Bdellovibrionales bacterium]